MTINRTLTAPTPAPREQLPSDSYPARLVGFIYLWTQPGSKQYPTPKIKVRLTYEFPTELREFKDWEKKPFLISQEYTFWMNKNGKFKPAVEAMLWKTMTDEEAKAFNVLSLIEQPYFVTVIHNESWYADIQNVMKLPKSMVCPEQITPTQLILQEDWEKEWENIPEFIQNKIKQSKEYQELTSSADITPEDWDTLNEQEI